MKVGALVVAACLVPHAASAAPPPEAAAFAGLPAPGKLIESGAEKDHRFRTYLVGKKPTSTGEITIFVGEIHMRVQNIGTPRAPQLRKWTYAARCSGPASTISVHIQSIAPREKAQTTIQVMPGVRPDAVDLTWYNVWYAVCLDEFVKYPRSQEE